MEGTSSDERRALVTELVHVLDAVRQLEAHMLVAGHLGVGGAAAAAGGEERCRALVSTMRASIDRSVHIATSCCAEPRLPVAVGQRSESPPSDGGDHGGSPRSAGSDQAGDPRGRGNAGGQYKKRKTLPKCSMQVRVSAVQDMAPLDDGLSWRKYGQKDILGAKYPRAYFRCTHRHTQGCHASKQVQRTDGHPLLFDVVYHGNHTCAQAAAHANSNQQMMRPGAAGAEHSQAQEEQTTASGGFEGHNTDKPATGGGATTSCFRFGCVMESPFVAPPTSECQMLASGSYNVVGGGGSMAGVRNVAEVELASSTNSPMAMGAMDFMFPLDADFLENPSSYF